MIEAGLIGFGKKWEKLPVNKNNKVIKVKMHVKKGDHVIIIAGSEKGTTGDIARVHLCDLSLGCLHGSDCVHRSVARLAKYGWME